MASRNIDLVKQDKFAAQLLANEIEQFILSEANMTFTWRTEYAG